MQQLMHYVEQAGERKNHGVQQVTARRRRSQTYCWWRKSTENSSKMGAKWSPNRPKINQNREKVIPRRPPDPIWEKNACFWPKCTAKWSQNGAQMVLKSRKNRVRKRADFWHRFFIVSGWFLEEKVVENDWKSVSEGAREWKRRFPENVGFTIVKPWFSRPEASGNEVILERKSFQVSVAAQGRKNTRKKRDFGQFWWPKRRPFPAKTLPKNESKKKRKKCEKAIPGGPRTGRIPKVHPPPEG